MYVTDQPIVSHILENPNIKEKSAQIALLQRDQSKSNLEVDPKPVIDFKQTYTQTENTNAATGQTDTQLSQDETEDLVSTTKREKILKLISVLPRLKLEKSEKVLDIILKSNQVSIGSDNNLIVNQKFTNVKVHNFLYNLQQPTKKIDKLLYGRILSVLKLPPNLVRNTHVKQLLQESATKVAEKKVIRQRATRLAKNLSTDESDGEFGTLDVKNVWESY